MNTENTTTATDDTAVVEKAVNRRGAAKTGNPVSDRKANAAKAAKTAAQKRAQGAETNIKIAAEAEARTTALGESTKVTGTKITALTALNVRAITEWADELKVTTGKTTAEFKGTPAEAAKRVREVQNKVRSVEGGRSTTYTSLHAVLRKLEALPTPAAGKADNEAEVESQLDQQARDKAAQNPKGVHGKSVQDAVKEETAKRTAKKAAAKAPAKKAPRVLKEVAPTNPQAKVPAGYVPRYTHKSYDLFSTVPGEGKIKWITVCNAHGSYTEADGGRDGDVKGTKANRETWCKGCEADAKKAEKTPATKAPAKKAPAKKAPAAK